MVVVVGDGCMTYGVILWYWLLCVSAIDGYGFSFTYVDRGNTTDNTFQSLYDFFFIEYNVIYIYIYTVRLI